MYQKFKDTEESLRKRVTSLGYTVRIEPIAALDLFYSDGLVGSCYGKAIFTKKNTEYQIFFPYYCLNIAVPEDLQIEFKKWLEDIN
jgi:hypothetical protein